MFSRVWMCWYMHWMDVSTYVSNACMYVRVCVIILYASIVSLLHFLCRQLEATVVCDCHISWLMDVLLEFPSHPSGSLTCSSANPVLDGQDVVNANGTIINDTCPGECLPVYCHTTPIWLWAKVLLTIICYYYWKIFEVKSAEGVHWPGLSLWSEDRQR